MAIILIIILTRRYNHWVCMAAARQTCPCPAWLTAAGCLYWPQLQRFHYFRRPLCYSLCTGSGARLQTDRETMSRIDNARSGGLICRRRHLQLCPTARRLGLYTQARGRIRDDGCWGGGWMNGGRMVSCGCKGWRRLAADRQIYAEYFILDQISSIILTICQVKQGICRNWDKTKTNGLT